MKKQFGVALLAGLLGWMPLVSWAETNILQEISILPLPDDKVIVKVESENTPNVEVVDKGSNPAILFKSARVDERLIVNNHLISEAYVRPSPAAARVLKQGGNTWLVFETKRPLVFFVVTAEPAFLNELARELPLYPVFPRKGQPVRREQKDQWQIIQRTRSLPQSASKLEALYYGTLNPDKALYSELLAIYRKSRDTAKVFCLAAEGAKQFPDLLGLPYSAFLYQYHQPDKAIQVLSDMVQHKSIAKLNKAQAYYMMGTIQTEKHEFENAINSLENASTVFANNPTVLYNLGVAYEASERKDQAQATYQKALPFSKGELKSTLEHRISELKSPNYKGIDLTPIEFEPENYDWNE